MWRNLANAVRELRRSFGHGTCVYRPDLYYMRGPGPKWQAKYGAPVAKPVAFGARTTRQRRDQPE